MSNLFPFPTLNGELSGSFSIQGEIDQNVHYQTYSGEYEIKPLFGLDQELKTQNRVLDENIVVKQIPYFETPTLNGGITVYIGKEE